MVGRRGVTVSMLATILSYMLIVAGCAGDAPERSAGDAGEVPTEGAYPEGPYGVTIDSIIEDFVFYDPATGQDVWLHQWHQHPSVRMLMIGSTAVW